VRSDRPMMDEHGVADVSYPVVRAYVAERKPQVRAEAGCGPAEVFVPQAHRPGDEAEVDFGDVVVRLAGQEVRCFLFCLRLSFSGKAVHRFPCRAGRRRSSRAASTRSGSWGVPAGKIRYDDLKAAVAQVTGLSRLRVEADRWTAFRSHWWRRRFLLPARHRRRPRERRGRGGRSAGSAATTSSRSRSGVDRGAQRDDRPVGRR
jgi:hypothetical protein